MEIYTNPASEYIQIDFNAFTNTDITGLEPVGLDGKIVRVCSVGDANSSGVSLDLSGVQTGIYFIRMTTSYGSLVEEIVIE